jgi:hypothetical protein
MTKRTPLEQYLLALEQRYLAEAAYESAKVDISKKRIEDAEQTHRAVTETASPAERLKKFKRLQAWPRIVFDLYRSELAIAQNDRKLNGNIKEGEPSDIACDVVGEVVRLSEHRIRDLCREGRRHLRQGLPETPFKITAAEFKMILNGRLQHDPKETH